MNRQYGKERLLPLFRATYTRKRGQTCKKKIIAVIFSCDIDFRNRSELAQDIANILKQV